ncbi:MAG: stage II sporulation protein M [Saprospiraceae bacterium]|nr:stage II sporulation protein M [Saprospiraceae bacterium]
MRETKFIEQNKEKWADFEQMLRENRHDPDKLNNLFVQITDDLSYARTFYPNRSVRMYLNSLAQRIFHRVYRGKRFPVERLRLFWTDELPQLMWETRKALLLSFSIFVLAFAIGVLSSIINPDFARTILGDSYVDMTLENIQRGDPMAVYKQSGPFGMTVGIAANNLFVALRTAIFGVLASLGTVFIMLYNGIMVGAFQYFFIEQGVFWKSFLSIWIHGTLEISAIIIAGAAGLVAGSGLLFPGTYRRSQAFQISMRRGLKIFVGVAPIIVLAAVFEGFFTRFTETPDFIRAAFIATSLFFVLWYFVWLPWHKARTGGFRQAIHDKELPPDKAQIIDFNVIKNAGEILADTFTVVFRHPKMTLGVLSGATAVFMLWAFGWTTENLANTFLYPDQPLGVLGGASGFFENKTAPFLYFLQIGLLTVLSVAAFRALELEMDIAQRTRFSRGRVFLSALPLALIMPLFILFIRAENGVLAWLLSMAAYPFLGMWAAVIYFEDLNPITALIRTFRLVRWPTVVLGLMTINLMLLFFLFLDTPVWEMTMQLFSWLVPSGGDAMAIFHTIATTTMAGILLYLFFLMIVLGGALQYFSCREIMDATQLRKGIEQVALTRQIRGLARE